MMSDDDSHIDIDLSDVSVQDFQFQLNIKVCKCGLVNILVFLQDGDDCDSSDPHRIRPMLNGSQYLSQVISILIHTVTAFCELNSTVKFRNDVQVKICWDITSVGGVWEGICCMFCLM